ncbi:MAG: lipopolysaccharide heptosyltransferase I [Xanthomonadaceae bacterium]|nr:lipopolysaccharide heptosyltransferase I [Xanthomonadaceae bacterium]
MKVLMIKVSALGDIIHALPVAAYLKSCPAVSELHWLVEEPFAGFLSGQPLIDKIQGINTKTWRHQGILASLKGVLTTISRLRREKYDLVLDLQGNSKSGMFTRFSGAPLRYGFDAQGVREWPNLLATNCHITPKKSTLHIIDKNLALATNAFPGGSPAPLQGPLEADSHYLFKVQKKLSALRKEERQLVIFHYGTTWDTKLWSIESWIELARSLWGTKTITPLLTWGNEKELEAVKRIASACPQTIIWPRGNLEELIALLSIADVVVGGDTGPIHIAAALGTSTISYYRATDHRRNGPRGDQHICIQTAMDCSPCLLRTCPKDEQCRHSVLPEKMLEAVQALLTK